MSQSPLSMSACLIDLDWQVQTDADSDEASLHQRDREIGLKLAHLKNKPRKQVAHWLQALHDSHETTPGRQIMQAQRAITLVLIVLGLLAGGSLALHVFDYDGSRPVNVMYALAVLVGLQLLFLFLSIIVMLPSDLLRKIPGLGAIQDTLRLLSPGRLQGLIARFLPQAHRQRLEVIMGQSKAHQARYGRIQTWAVFRWSQLFSVALNIGALVVCFSLIIFKDLAFSWSSTLQIEPAAFHNWTSLLSAPWSAVISSAVPSLELVEATRYYSLERGVETAVDAAKFGGWWAFLLTAIFFYGLLPRLLTLLLAQNRFNTAVNRVFENSPGFEEIYDRLNRQWVETQSPEFEPASEPKSDAAKQPEVQAESEPVTPTVDVPIDNSAPLRIVIWSTPVVEEAQIRQQVGQYFQRNNTEVQYAGGSRSLDEDLAVAAALGKSEQRGPIVFVVKAWEPPLGEFGDFLGDVRQEIGPDQAMTVMPVGHEGENLAAPEEHYLAEWKRFVGTLGDPWLRVKPFGQSGA
ncbi:MAG: DUF2868 domain-containing protein [Pseudomonadota bacterium]